MGMYSPDYDKHGKLLGLRCCAPCQASVLDNIAKQGQPSGLCISAIPGQCYVTS